MKKRLLIAGAILATTIAAALIFQLNGGASLFETQALLRTFMHDSAGLSPNAPVRLDGIIAGRVKQVVLSGSSDPRRATEVDMLVPRGYLNRIPVDSHATITAANLLGDKYIDISLGTSAEHVKEGSEIASQQTTDIPQVIAQASGLLSLYGPLLARLNALLDESRQGQGNVGQLFYGTSFQDSINRTAPEVRQIVKDAKSGSGALGHVSDLSDDVKKPMQRWDAMLADARKTQYPQLIDEANVAIADAKQLMNDLKSEQMENYDIGPKLEEIAKKLDQISANEGTLKLISNNPALSDAMASASREFSKALKDYNANPKKFRTIRITFF